MFSVFLNCIACDQKTDTTASNETIELNDPMEGVWQQIHHYLVANGDTVSSSNAEGEHKIYFDGYVMFARDPAKDSLENYGFGTYRYENDTVIEKLLAGSGAGHPDIVSVFQLAIYLLGCHGLTSFLSGRPVYYELAGCQY